MAVKPGFKQTEVGVIPEEWATCTLGEGIALLSGHHILAQYCNTMGNGVPYLTGPADFPAGVIAHTKFTDRPATLCKPEDILVTVKGSGAGTLVVADDVYCISRQLMAIRVREWDKRFVFYSLLENASQFQAASTGLIPGLSRSDILEQLLPLPTLPEQRAIATALSDVDALLGALERLIAKKRDLKQAAMQQLLTGQTRLPGFRGEWEVKTLGDLGSTFGGLTGKTKADFGEGSGRYVTFMNVMTNVVIDCGTFERVKISPTESQNRLVKGDLLFNGSSETPEEVAMCALLTVETPNLFLNSFCFGFRFREGVEADGLFLAYYLRSKAGRELMKSLAQGSTRYNLSKVALLRSSLRLPSLPEQTAITAVLSDMDAELAALEQRLAKTRALKQGMMQELLTGRTRLL